jgi:hypothetical protein
MKKKKVCIMVPVTIIYDEAHRGKAQHDLLRMAKEQVAKTYSNNSTAYGWYKLGRATSIDLDAFRKKVLNEACAELMQMEREGTYVASRKHTVVECVNKLQELSNTRDC